MKKKLNWKKIFGDSKETRKNKEYAVILMAVGVLSLVLTGSIGFLAMWGVIALGLFFSKKNWIDE